MTIPEAFQVALQHHQAGRLAEAEALYRQILAAEPRHADALHLLGVIAHQVGQSELALKMISQAIALTPAVPTFHSNLGEAHRAAGNLDAAIAAYHRAIELNPNSADAHYNLGLALSKQGRVDEAIATYRRAIGLKPELAEAHNNLGIALKEQGHLDEAIAAYRRALELKPDFAEAHNNLGAALFAQNEVGQAITAYRRALELKPDYAMAWNNLGLALLEQARTDEAVAAYQCALKLDPDFAEAHNNLGNALRRQARDEEAAAAYRRALELKPDFAEAHNNLGNVLTEQSRFDEAIGAYHRALEINPHFAAAYNNLGVALKDQGHFDRAIVAYRRAFQLKPDYAEAHNNLGATMAEQSYLDEAIAAYRRALDLKPDYAEARSSLLFSLHYPGSLDAGSLFQEHRRWDEIHARPLAKSILPHPSDRDPERRLRIGYVSPDFREHSVAFFLENLLASHDPAQVEVFCYADLFHTDAVTTRFQNHPGSWRAIAGMTDAQAAELIRKDAIDILVDLAGHTVGNRLLTFARKPAPVQVTYLGYCNTTGMSTMDYRLTDAHADPPGTTEHLHSEQLVRLPECAWCFRPPDDAPPVAAPPFTHAGRITFGCFNVLPKITGEMLALWSQILQQVPGSRLLLKNRSLRDYSVRQRTHAFLQKAGIAPERVELLGHTPTLAGHLATYNRVDIALDTFPYHGTTTTCEALWMGVPVATLAGRTHAARVGVSLLRNLGLPGLIARSAAEYVQIAASLAADLPRLAQLRSTLRGRMAASPLTDGPRFARHVEHAYRQMWRAWCARQIPGAVS